MERSMFDDARAVPKGTRLETDVCIVGAGAAGITIARELIGFPLRVIVLESGGFQFDPETQDLFEGPSVGLRYDLKAPRLRFFGGSTNKWGGICRPFEEADFAAREGIPFTGWPIGKRDVDPFYRRAERVVRLPSPHWQLDQWTPDGTTPPLRFRNDRIVNRVAQIVRPNLRSFGTNYKEELRSSSNVTVYLHANVTGLETDRWARTVTSARVATLSGNRFSVAAKRFVLATGAVENARLLLVSNERMPDGLGNQNGVVGRFFLEHPRFLGALIAPFAPHPNLEFYERHPVGQGVVHGYLASSKALQLAEGLLDVQLRLEADYGEAPRKVPDFSRHVMALAAEVRSWQKIAVPGSPLPVPYFQVIRHALRSPKETYIHLRSRIETLRVTARFEPAPNPDSRVFLVRDRDRLGIQRVGLDWRLSEVDKRNVRRTLELFGAEIARAGIGRLKILFDERDPGWPEDIKGGHHLMGATRMSGDPKQGVVDRNCRVHGMSNLFVAGSSVFPTAGGATPTLMIVALAIRLADHLKGQEPVIIMGRTGATAALAGGA
jgi:choline dehydrogenase-like flavoprotein